MGEGRGGGLPALRFLVAGSVACLLAALPGRRPVAVGLCLSLVDFGLDRYVMGDANWVLLVVQSALWLATFVYVIVTLLEAIFESESVSVETLQASLCVYLLLGLLWVFVYALIDGASPGSFQSSAGAGIARTGRRSRRAQVLGLLTFSYSSLSGAGGGDLWQGTGLGAGRPARAGPGPRCGRAWTGRRGAERSRARGAGRPAPASVRAGRRTKTGRRERCRRPGSVV